MPQWITAFFAWPNGGVWSNLLASAITVVPGFVVHHKLIKRHIDRAVQQAPEQQQEASTP